MCIMNKSFSQMSDLLNESVISGLKCLQRLTKPGILSQLMTFFSVFLTKKDGVQVIWILCWDEQTI